MSNGQTARAGFRFSDLVVIERLLQHIAQARLAKIDGRDPAPSPIFYVESRQGQGPDWDIQEHSNEPSKAAVLEEVKSGPVAAPDRRVLWRRFKRTIVSSLAGAQTTQILRLTTNRDNPTPHEDRWRALSRLAHAATGVTAPSSVDSAEALAEEALYYLTHADQEDEDSALPVATARTLLQTFEFNNARGAHDLEQAVTDLVGLLSHRSAEDELKNAMLGELGRRAASPDSSERHFTPADILTKVEILGKLADVDSTAVQLLRSWQDLSAGQAPPETPAAAPGLAYVDWRMVQPEVASATAGAVPMRIALTGRGGIGKSVILSRLRAELTASGDDALQLSGADLRAVNATTVQEALGLAAFKSRVADRTLYVFIDGFENAGDTPEELRDILTALSNTDGADALTFVLSARASEWAGLSGSQERVPNWTVIELKDWDDARVREIVHVSQRPTIGLDLLRLLGTPLLLDLFLRTFGVADSVPSGLQTRHGVLLAYWSRRVLPARPEAVERRVDLMACCVEEATGRRYHSIAHHGMQQLESEGVFAPPRNGAYAFRHPFLRDFAMMQWLAEGTAADLIGRLQGISDGLVHRGALTALIEAGASPSDDTLPVPRLAELIPTLWDRHLVASAAEVLGEMEDPPSAELMKVLDTIGDSVMAVTFVQRLLQLAKLSSNAGWLEWLSRLPARPEWPDHTSWVGKTFLVQAADLLEVVSRSRDGQSGTRLSSVAQLVAERIRDWSAANKFEDDLTTGEFFHLGRIMPLVATFAPTQASLTWLQQLVSRSWRTRWGALAALPHLVVQGRARGVSLPGDQLVSLYLEAAGYQRTPNGLGRVGPTAHGPVAELARTSIALLGHDPHRHRHHGLLEEDTPLFLPVALDVLACLATEERLEHEKALGPALRALATLHDDEEPSSPTQIDLLEQQLATQAGDPMTPAEALGHLVDDTDYPLYPNDQTERGHIIGWLRGKITADLAVPNGFVERTYWPVARAGRSAMGWILLLDMLTSTTPPRHTEIVDELLLERIS